MKVNLLTVFWVVLAVLYLVLAIMSLKASAAYNDRVEHAPSIWVEEVDGEKILHFFGSPQPGQVSTADLFRDLANYLTQVTWITSVGFILAFGAVLLTLKGTGARRA
jgi:predicted RNA-binding Zn-ribbon protein involved in translation (DUF1610 family)